MLESIFSGCGFGFCGGNGKYSDDEDDLFDSLCETTTASIVDRSATLVGTRAPRVMSDPGLYADSPTTTDQVMNSTPSELDPSIHLHFRPELLPTATPVVEFVERQCFPPFSLRQKHTVEKEQSSSPPRKKDRQLLQQQRRPNHQQRARETKPV